MAQPGTAFDLSSVRVTSRRCPFPYGRIVVAAHAEQEPRKTADVEKHNNHKGNQEWALLGSTPLPRNPTKPAN